MKCPMCDKDLPLAHDVDSGRTTLFEHGKPHRCAAHARLVEAAKRVIDLYDEDQMDSLGFAARRMTAMTALRAALAEVDRG